LTGTVTVTHGDALVWLRTAAPGGLPYAYLTSPPDAFELGLALGAWEEFYRAALASVFAAAAGAPVCVYATDRRAGGRLISKAAIIIEEGKRAGAPLTWHRIAQPARRNAYRPGYAHLLAFGGQYGRYSSDVLPPSPQLYPDGCTWAAARAAVRWAAGAGATHIIDPFCGQGTFLLAALEAGLAATGVDIDPACVARAGGLARKLLAAPPGQEASKVLSLET
jgi:hypothetical protein